MGRELWKESVCIRMRRLASSARYCCLPLWLLSETRRLRDVLEAKGYRVIYSEFVGGHNEVCWRGSFANAVMALTARRRP